MSASNVATLCPGCFADKGRANPCPQCGYDERTDRGQAPLPHRTLLKDQFLVGRVLGKPGGFGITYLGRDLLLETLVAIKELLPLGLVGRAADRLNVTLQSSHDGAAFREVLEQFLREGRTAFQLEHPNIVRVRHVFEANRTAYLVMDYFPGLSLDELVQRKGGRLPEDQAKQLLLPILDGLRAVHAKGILHRDLKPQNIYLAHTEAGGLRPILLDFGSARRAVREYGLTMPLVTHGWAPYEQYHSNLKEGPYSDIYAAAAVLYWMVTGTVPPDAYERQKRDLLKPATTFGISPALSQAITEAMAMDPRQRPQTIERFQALLVGTPQSRPAAHDAGANQRSSAATDAKRPEAEAIAGRRPTQSGPTPIGESDQPKTSRILSLTDLINNANEARRVSFKASSANRAAGPSEAKGRPALGARTREDPPGYGAAKAAQQATGSEASSGKQLSDIESVASLIVAAVILFVLTAFFGDRWFNWGVVAISLIAPLPGGILLGRFLSLRRRKLTHSAMMLGLIGLGFGAAIIILAVLQGLEIVTIPSLLLNECISVLKISALVYIPLLGQYLWRHRWSMSHNAVAIGIIMVSLCVYFSIGLPMYGDLLSAAGKQGNIVIAYLLSVGLSGQYFWRYRWILGGADDTGSVIGIISLCIISVYTWVQL